MKKFLALGYMLALPLVSGAKILPSIVAILLFSTAPAGVLASVGIVPGLFGGSLGALFTYFVTGFFPAPAISNFIMGLWGVRSEAGGKRREIRGQRDGAAPLT
jgi:hypothetical protein